MTIPEMNARLIAANVRWAMHRRSGNPVAEQEAWDEAESLALRVYMAEQAQRFAEMRDASMAQWDVLKGHPDHSGVSHA